MRPQLNWKNIDLVMLDMDGTLLDLNFDNYFWLDYVPRQYARANNLSEQQARHALHASYARMEGQLQWYCVDHWSRELGLDIALLKQEIRHLIAVHPHVVEFLQRLKDAGKAVWLVTNAHQKSLQLKLEQTRLSGFFDRVICAHDIGAAKEQQSFWRQLRQRHPFEPARALFVDDSPAVVESARRYGIRWVIALTHADTRRPPREHEHDLQIRDFSELLPL